MNDIYLELSNVKSITTYSNSNYALTYDNQLYCYGENIHLRSIIDVPKFEQPTLIPFAPIRKINTNNSLLLIITCNDILYVYNQKLEFTTNNVKSAIPYYNNAHILYKNNDLCAMLSNRNMLVNVKKIVLNHFLFAITIDDKLHLPNTTFILDCKVQDVSYIDNELIILIDNNLYKMRFNWEDLGSKFTFNDLNLLIKNVSKFKSRYNKLLFTAKDGNYIYDENGLAKLDYEVKYSDSNRLIINNGLYLNDIKLNI
jgi:hypothetical protein